MDISGKKTLLWSFAIIFAILSIVCYSNSEVTIDRNYTVANMQMTVFTGVCIILTVINVVGAIILSALNELSSMITKLKPAPQDVSAATTYTNSSTNTVDDSASMPYTRRMQKHSNNVQVNLANGSNSAVTSFLASCQEARSMRDIYQLWSQANLADQYAEVDKYISTHYRVERIYGRDIIDMNEKKQTISDMLNS